MAIAHYTDTQRRNKMSNDFQKQAQDMTTQFAEQIKAAMPTIKTNANGYEIRTQVLNMAKEFTEFEYSVKFNGFEQTSKRDPETGEIVNTVNMPEVPGVDNVLAAAQKFYDFVNNAGK